jgi:hypothetical protein
MNFNADFISFLNSRSTNQKWIHDIIYNIEHVRINKIYLKKCDTLHNYQNTRKKMRYEVLIVLIINIGAESGVVW